MCLLAALRPMSAIEAGFCRFMKADVAMTDPQVAVTPIAASQHAPIPLRCTLCKRGICTEAARQLERPFFARARSDHGLFFDDCELQMPNG
jgi:hypothetical protein